MKTPIFLSAKGALTALGCLVGGILPVHASQESCADLLVGLNEVNQSSTDRCVYLGLAGGIYQSEYEDDSEAVAFPVIAILWDVFYWDTNEIGMYFLGEVDSNSYWALAAMVRYVNPAYSQDDAEQLAGLADREETVEGGLRANFGGRWGEFQLGIAHDLGEVYDGYVGELRFLYPFDFSSFNFAPMIEARYQDEKFSNYYYGVSPENSLATRPTYQLSNTVNLSVGYSLSYSLNSQWSIFQSTSYTFLDEDIRNSPLVVNDSSVLVLAGIVYEF